MTTARVSPNFSWGASVTRNSASSFLRSQSGAPVGHSTVGQGTGDGCGGSGTSAYDARAKSIKRKTIRASIGRMVIRPWLKRTLIIVVVLVVAGAVAWRALHLSEMAHIGAGYVAE